MKKMLSLLFVMIICFSISSCGSSESSDTRTNTDIPQTEDNNTVSQLKDKVQSTDNCAAVIRLQINPVFDIYVDKDNNVISVDSLNSDAQQVISYTDITGHNCIDGIRELINAAFATGIVKGDTSVTVIPVCGEYNPQTEEMIKDIPSAVSDTYHNFYVKVEIGDEMVEVQDTGDADTDDTAEVSDIETNDPDIQVIKDAKGNIIKSVQVDGVGNIVTYFYDEDGRLTRHITEESDGTMTETTLDGNGKPLFQTGTSGDGGIIENTYHLNGEVKSATTKYADGAYNRQIFDKNGIKLIYEGAQVRVDGVLTEFKFRYDANGNETDYWGQDNFGRPVHRINNPDGTSVTYRTEEDGTVTTIYYDADGKIIH